MILYNRIFVVALLLTHILTTNSLHASQPNTKKITQKNILLHDAVSYGKPITDDILFTKMICKEHAIPKEIAIEIGHYTILLRHKTFMDHFTRRKEWKQFNIPKPYAYLLSSEQLNLMNRMFAHRPTIKVNKTSFQVLPYALESKNDYKLFVTLPLELRHCLITTPQPERKLLYNPYAIYIVSSNKKYPKEKLIIPENKKSNNK